MYNFVVEKITNDLILWIRNWFEHNGNGCNAVVGLSGGKDSTVVAALCARALGEDRVIGVAMPDDSKKQGINGADKISEYLGIKFKTVKIGKICHDVEMALGYGIMPGYCISKQAEQNIPPRVRMTVLYAIAQTENGRVACCDNASENYIGYSTFGGDDLGAFAPLGNLTVTEVRAIGHYLGLPDEWIDKTPDDGLPNSNPDEIKIGFTYEALDRYLREKVLLSPEVLEKIEKMHNSSEFKRNIIKVPAFEPEIFVRV